MQKKEIVTSILNHAMSFQKKQIFITLVFFCIPYNTRVDTGEEVKQILVNSKIRISDQRGS